jgi:hypothetical protein
MGIWDDIEKAEVFTKGKWLEPGLYEVEVTACKENDRQAANGEAFIVEMTVLSTSRPDDHPVGSTASWVRKFDTPTKTKMSHSAMLEFFCAAMGFEPTKVNAEKIKARLGAIQGRITGEENLLRGKRVKVETFHTGTRAGGLFTIHRWSPVVAT